MDPQDVKKVTIIGAGVMGHSIAQVFAQAGIEVNLVDLKEEVLQHAMELIGANLETLAEHGSVVAQSIPGIVNRIHPLTDLESAVQDCGFVLEAVVEVAEVKKTIYDQLNRFCPKDTVLASNTSGLNVFDIAKIEAPERMVVAHWFTPPHIVPLVEVVPGPHTSPAVMDFTAGLMKRIGKEPIRMKKFVPSFIVNRIQNYISMATMEMLVNGWADPEDIDKAIKYSLGVRMPIVGVVQTLDFNGLDLALDIIKANGLQMPIIEEKVAQNQLGVKTSKGLYDYHGRSEKEILKKRDLLFSKMLDGLRSINAFEPV